MNYINSKFHNSKAVRVVSFFICIFLIFNCLLPAALPAFETKADDSYLIGDFPDDYKRLLAVIHDQYPNYVFQADHTYSNFYDVLDIQNSDHRRLVSMNTVWGDGISWRAMNRINYDWTTNTWINTAGNWTDASYEVIAYYMDPRNFLTTDKIYSFMQQSYDDFSKERIRNTLIDITRGTFLADTYTVNKDDPNDVKYKGSYIDVIMYAGERSGVNPIVLAAIILQEQGTSGSLSHISGTYPDYEGYYNFFNFKANGKSETEVIVNGLKYAKEQNWNSRFAAIVGGSNLYADGYINNGQDTYYYKDYNVVLKDYNHQYAQSVYGHKTSANWLNFAFSSDHSLSLYFKIPVFDNMPSEPCARPAENSLKNNYYFKMIKMNGLSPSFDMYTFNYSASVSGDTYLTLAVPDKADLLCNSYYNLTKGDNTIIISAQAETGYTRDYYLHINSTTNCSLIVSKGDANGDGVIDVFDYIAIKNHIMKRKLITNKTNLSAADANMDGVVDVFDYIRVKNIIMNRMTGR